MLKIDNELSFLILQKAIKGTKSAIVGQLLVLILIAHHFSHFVPPLLLGGWILAHLLTYMTRWILSSRYMRLENKPQNYKKANTIFYLYTFALSITSVLWGSAVFFLSFIPASYHYLLYMIFVGFTFASVLSVGAVIPMYLAFNVPMNIAAIYYIFTRYDTNYYIDVVLFIMLAYLYSLKLAKEYLELYGALIQETLRVQRSLKEISLQNQNNKAYLEAIDSIGIGIVTLSSNGTILSCNTTAKELLGEVAGERYETLLQRIGAREKKEFGATLLYFNPTKVYLLLSTHIFDAQKGELTIKIFKDISREYSQKETLAKLAKKYRQKAQNDPLTHILNREAFFEELQHALYEADRKFEKIAILFVDVDGFKEINDTYGHSAGDEVLKIVTRRLQNIIRQEDLLARFGGDEFVIALKHIDSIETARGVATKILNHLAQPIAIDNNTVVNITGSIGISIYPDHSNDIKALVDMADISMYRVKRAEKNNYAFYKGEDDAQSF